MTIHYVGHGHGRTMALFCVTGESRYWWLLFGSRAPSQSGSNSKCAEKTIHFTHLCFYVFSCANVHQNARFVKFMTILFAAVGHERLAVFFEPIAAIVHINRQPVAQAPKRR